MIKYPHVVFHDQECIDLSMFPQVSEWYMPNGNRFPAGPEFPWFKIKTMVPQQFYNKVIIVHSEYNSQAIDTITQQGFIPVHVFSHGLIARDWYRYAEHDPVLRQPKKTWQNIFLIYNRAWSGTREYRMKFAELLCKDNLVKHCKTSFSFYDDQKHYSEHKFANPHWQTTTEFENYIGPNLYQASASADYEAQDYVNTLVEIVLETQFDQNLVHLTEKTLRPIACGQPFMLLAGSNALDYLKQYGFKTFAPWINEDYDKIQDPKDRMKAVLEEMHRLSLLNEVQIMKVVEACKPIAAFNRQHFFSKDFQDIIVKEYQDGITKAVAQCRSDVSRFHWDQWAEIQDVVPDVSDVMQYVGIKN